VTYVGAVRAALSGAGDPERAAQQQAYMKSELPYVGLGAPALKALLRPLLVEHRFVDRAQWEAAVLELWEDAEHREEWYAAIALLRHRSYRAWLDPDLLRGWLAPGVEVKRIEIDERVGGFFRVWHGSADIDVGGFDGEILELVPDRRIVFRLGFVGPERRKGPAYDTLLTVALREAPHGKTALTLVHERLDDLAAGMPDIADNVENGWELVLDQLAILLSERT